MRRQGNTHKHVQCTRSALGKEPTSFLGLVLGLSLSLFILGILGYALARWCREGPFWHRPYFVFNLYHIRLLSLEQVGASQQSLQHLRDRRISCGTNVPKLPIPSSEA
uniref:Uncharacterized protein n=1 Tax=Sphaerodactylus townsendi TaxID=933632 RepID=A0ACB8EYZ5_9SAUR